MTPLVYVLRHGRSIANEHGLIASSPTNAADAFGLTALGEEQVRESISRAQSDGLLTPPFTLLSSPLLRAKQSADVVAEVLGVSPTIDTRLTERGFGDLELVSEDRYERVWAEDRLDPTHNAWDVESVSDVLSRVRQVVVECTAEEGTGTVVLCTHGDVASTLICASLGLALHRHREVGALETGELRALSTLDGLRETSRG